MICEMCGQEAEATYRVEIEGSVLRVCEACRRFGRVLDPLIAPSERPPAPTGRASSAPPRGGRPRNTEERDLFAELPEMELAQDWGHRIRIAREARNWSPEELGKRLNEKKSLVLKLESGNFRPPDPTIRKVERLLGIRLRADPKETA
ncbi:MAG TPA: multiprotein-bridging factor 1 family protein, partial [Thermoplasmata archaeon]|nr:multiprotein-bridging factor 1 family protein [Thermoplasmata archaeon]